MRDLLARETQPPPVVDQVRLAAALDRLFAGGCARSARRGADGATRWTTVLGGGPGTGKTTTVARVLALLLDQPGPAAAGRAGRADRQGGRPAAGGGAAGARRLRPADRDRLGTTDGVDDAPVARHAARRPRPIPLQPRPTGCLSTSSSSTRPQWCR